MINMGTPIITKLQYTDNLFDMLKDKIEVLQTENNLQAEVIAERLAKLEKKINTR